MSSLKMEYNCSVLDSTFHFVFGDTWLTTDHEEYTVPDSIKHTSMLIEIFFERPSLKLSLYHSGWTLNANIIATSAFFCKF